MPNKSKELCGAHIQSTVMGDIICAHPKGECQHGNKASNCANQEYQRGFIDGGNACGNQAEEIIACKIHEIEEMIGGLRLQIGLTRIIKNNKDL